MAIVHLMGNDFYDTASNMYLFGVVKEKTVTPIIKKIRKNRAVRGRGYKSVNMWRLAVLKRDNYTCQSCGKRDDLQVHHQVHFKDISISAHEFIFNGITLCAGCHGDKHPELPQGVKRGLYKFTTKAPVKKVAA